MTLHAILLLFRGAFGLSVLVGLSGLPALAGPQPVRPLARIGGCPTDYISWDSYCIPARTVRGAFERIGSYCPTGFETSGAYCVAYPNTREASPKVGYSCPPGWDASGSYCLSP